MSKGQKHRRDRIVADARNSASRLDGKRKTQHLAHQFMQARVQGAQGEDTQQYDDREQTAQFDEPRGPDNVLS